MSKSKYKNTFIYTFLIFIAVLQIFPFYYSMVHSLQPYGFIRELTKWYFVPDRFSYENYAAAWERIHLSIGFTNTIIVAVSSTIITAIIAMFVGYILAKKKFRGRTAIFLAFMVTMMVPIEVLIIPLFIIARTLNITNSLFGLVFPGLINVFGIFIAKQFMETIPDSYIESAVIDGAGEFKIFTRIVMPMAQSALATYCIIQFTGVWNEYLWPYVSINDPSKYTIQLCLAQLVNSNFAGNGMVDKEWDEILRNAASIATILPVVIIFFIFQKRFVQGIVLSGIKS